MALTNSQYDKIMREYSERRLLHEHELRVRLDAAYGRFPRLAELDGEIASVSMKKARILLGNDGGEDFDLKEALSQLYEERSALLTMAGLPDGKAEPEYDCTLCKDTGYVGSSKCSCFIKKEAELLYSQSRLSDVLESENFDTFSLKWYSKELKHPSTGLSARETAKLALDYAKRFTRNFPKNENICFFGKTGVGKTFLSHCIAKELMDKGFSVLYLTAFDLFSIFEANTFHQTEETRENTQLIFECDLLIIDDLGANMNNSFISSQLFHCINERLLTRKSTIISTNLSISDLRDAYSDRVVSRMNSAYQRILLFGEDIRIKKKLSGGNTNVSD